jgi:hypothetical protein
MTNVAEKHKALPDFEVSYRFFSESEGGRKTGPPYQSYRCDWSYEDNEVFEKTGISVFQIWPIFLDATGGEFPAEVQVPVSGKAAMWIIKPKTRGQIHQAWIKEGARGFFMEGSRRVAVAIVTRIVGLHTNPT